MKKILIPTDFSKNSKNAIRYALDFFKETPCQFYLLYINIEGSKFTEKPIYEFGTNILVELEPKAINKKLKDLEKFIMAVSSKKEHHHFTSICEQGYFLSSVQRHIEEKKIELIIMGTKGASEIKEFFIGSRSGDVITNVECDALVVPENTKFKDFEQVVLPIDFEITYDDTTLFKISNYITSKSTHINLLYVTKSKIPLLEEIEVLQKQFAKRLSLKIPNNVSFHRVVSKKIEHGIQSFSKSINADLIIMISKDYNLLQKIFLDTTVEEVSFETSIPLLSLQG